MEVSEVLERALRLLEDDGWCQGTYRLGMGHCAVGALWSVLGDAYTWDDGRSLMMACLASLRNVAGIGNIAIWNDDPARTFAQVRETYRRAICEAELHERVAA